MNERVKRDLENAAEVWAACVAREKMRQAEQRRKDARDVRNLNALIAATGLTFVVTFIRLIYLWVTGE
jgi:hypothetical protein